jgi:DNA-binding PadR family transcriptional regulator
MEVPLSVKAAVLQALFSGPGDRSDLVKRIEEHARGGQKVPPREMSRALHDLEAGGLVRHWVQPSGEKRTVGSSVYYELTVEGVAASASLRDVVAGFLADGEGRRGRKEERGMEARLRRSLEISALAQNLRRGNRKLRT